MMSMIGSISSLLTGVGIMLLGNGLLSTLLVLRASAASYTDFTIGIIMSMYFVGSILGTLYLPRLIKRIGHIRTYTIMASLAACAVLLHGLIMNPIVWGLLRIVIGVAAVGIYMVIESWLNEVSAQANRGRVLAVYMMVTLLALAAGQFLVLIGEPHSPVPFMLAAGLIALSLIPIALTQLCEPKPIHDTRLSIKKILAYSPLGLVSVMCSGMATSVFWALGPLYAGTLGVSAMVPTFMSITIIGGFALQWPIGFASDYYGRYKVLGALCLLCAATAATIACLPDLELHWLLVLMFFLGGFMFSVYPLSVALTNDRLTHDQLVDASGNLLLLQGLGASLSPILAGALMTAFGTPALFLYLLSIMLILAAFTFAFSQRQPPHIEEPSPFVPMTRTSQVAFEIIENDKPT